MPVFIINRTPDQYEEEKNIGFIETLEIKNYQDGGAVFDNSCKSDQIVFDPLLTRKRYGDLYVFCLPQSYFDYPKWS